MGTPTPGRKRRRKGGDSDYDDDDDDDSDDQADEDEEDDEDKDDKKGKKTDICEDEVINSGSCMSVSRSGATRQKATQN